MTILIKRYANRKLYNTETSRYITLKGVGELLDQGHEVRVVDNETGEDITEVSLSQILVDNNRSREVPSDTLLSQILSRGGDAVYTAIRRSVDDASDGIGEFQERFRQLVQRGEAIRPLGPALRWDRRPRADGDEARHDMPRSAERKSTRETERDAARDAAPRDETRARASGDEATTGLPTSAAELGSLIREAVGRAFGARDWPTRTEIDRLNRNLERVVEALERLDESSANPRPRG